MNYPVPDRSDMTPNFVKGPDNDVLDIGWATGTLSGDRPYRAECWCQDQVTVLTIFFSRLGLEMLGDPDLEQLLVRERLVRFNDGPRYVTGSQFTDPSGHVLWSVNVVVGDDEDTFVAESMALTSYVRPVQPPPAGGPVPERPS